MRKFFITIFFAICAVFCALGAAACVPKDLQAHNYSEKWSHDIDEHWHNCTDSGCSARDSVAEHSWVITKDFQPTQREPKEPGCNSEGYGCYVCSVCGAKKEGAIPATGEHTWKFNNVVIPATCGETGEASYECSECHKTEFRTIPATGEHEFNTKKWDYSAEGHYHICAVCGAKSESEGHEAGQPVRTEPKNKVDGKSVTLCKICGYEMGVEVIPAPGVPASFDLTLTDDESRTAANVTKDDNGNFHARLEVAGYVNTAYRYDIGFENVLDKDGKPADMLNTRQLIFLYNEYTSERKELHITGSGSSEKVKYDDAGRIWLTEEGEYTLIIQIYTGTQNTDSFMVRAEIRLYINETAAAETANYRNLAAVDFNEPAAVYDKKRR